ncbi:MAG: ATP-grasp domain-containing protein [Acidobacteriota bacterium]|nr:ATP-grasp domain-containing protein [Blastocatellia bacterium]MDW8240677.1 ATP-grasp domain-containing protein [Acidobacteriota bacterium]
MPRLLLLLPTKTYRATDFLEAALRLNVDVVVASEEASALEGKHAAGLLTLNFLDPEEAAEQVRTFSKQYPINAVVGVDDETAIVAAQISAALGLPHNSIESVEAARNKHRLHELLDRAGVPSPRFTLFSLDAEPEEMAKQVEYPCVLKPTFLAASRGVIRANNEQEFITAFRRIEAILREPEVIAKGGPAARQLLVESYVPGVEVALEGLLLRGQLRVLALFDKPDPLEGPYFEETIYVTPSRLPAPVQSEIVACAWRAASALGLREGPIHAELRWNDQGPWIIEMAARSIGGLCSRTLRFGTGLSLEDLILKHALGVELESLEREDRAAGVMMIPVPRAGLLKDVRGIEAAQEVPHIENITITAHIGQQMVPLPEGSRYLGFIFARADRPELVETALREAHRRLEFVIT